MTLPGEPTTTAGSPDSGIGGPRPALAVLALMTALGAFLRLRGLGDAPLWVDEAATWWYGRQLLSGDVLARIRLEPTPPLYYLLIGGWTRLVGESTWALRLPGALAGIAAIPFAALVGSRLFDPRAGLWAACLLAVHPMAVATSRDARAYPFLVLAALGAMALVVRGAGGGRRAWILLCALVAATGWTHPYGVFLLAVAALLVLAISEGRSRWRGLGSLTVAGALILPWWILTLPHLRTSGAAWSVAELYQLLPDEASFARSLEMALIGARYNPFLRPLWSPPTPDLLRALSLATQAALLGLAGFAAVRRPAVRPGIVVAVGAWFGLVGIPWAIQQTGPALYHLGRHDVYALGAPVLLMGLGISVLWRWGGRGRGARAVAVLMLGILGVAAVQRLAGLATTGSSTVERRAGEWLAEHAEADDLAIALGLRRLVVEHPLRQAGSDLRIRSFPSETDDHPGWSDDRVLAEDRGRLVADAESLVAAAIRDRSRLFLLMRDYGPVSERASNLEWWVDSPLFEALARSGWAPDEPLSVPDLRILVVSPESSASAAPASGETSSEVGEEGGR